MPESRHAERSGFSWCAPRGDLKASGGAGGSTSVTDGEHGSRRPLPLAPSRPVVLAGHVRPPRVGPQRCRPSAPLLAGPKNRTQRRPRARRARGAASPPPAADELVGAADDRALTTRLSRSDEGGGEQERHVARLRWCKSGCYGHAWPCRGTFEQRPARGEGVSCAAD